MSQYKKPSNQFKGHQWTSTRNQPTSLKDTSEPVQETKKPVKDNSEPVQETKKPVQDNSEPVTKVNQSSQYQNTN